MARRAFDRHREVNVLRGALTEKYRMALYAKLGLALALGVISPVTVAVSALNSGAPRYAPHRGHLVLTQPNHRCGEGIGCALSNLLPTYHRPLPPPQEAPAGESGKAPEEIQIHLMPGDSFNQSGLPPLANQSISEYLSGRKKYDEPDDEHYWWEVASFRANVGLFFVNILLFAGGVWGICIAKRHSTHAKQHAEHVSQQNQIIAEQRRTEARARQAERYSNLYEALLSVRVRRGLRVTGELYAAHAVHSGEQTLGGYCAQQMTTWSGGPATDKRKFEAVGVMLDHIEHVGLLARRQYVEMDDVYYSHLGILTVIDVAWKDYLANVNAAMAPAGAFEHSLWLLDEIFVYSPTPGAVLPRGVL